MKGFCKDNRRLIKFDEASGIIDYTQLLGAKVRVKQISGMTQWVGKRNVLYTVQDVKFKILLDGKCYALVTLEECPENKFLLKDIEIESLNEEDDA
jgi:hypothetical protein